jgi:D-threo-aldose 1-dehydrogenase
MTSQSIGQPMDIPRACLGRSPVEITRLGLGSAPLGGLFTEVSDADAEATIERAWALGIRYFDTAPLYGYGLAEQRLGRFLRSKPREAFVLSTKVGRLLRRIRGDNPRPDRYYKGTPPERAVFDFSHDAVLRSVEESLQRLGLERVDILYIHDPDDHYEEAMKGALPALERLRREGTVGAIGAGMNQHQMLARFANAGPFDGFLLAGRYTLLDQGALDDLFPACTARGMGVVLGGVYNSGILADPHAGATFDYRPADATLVAKAQRLQALCREHAIDLKAAAIQFALGHLAVTGAVLGARTSGEIEESVAMAGQPIPAEFWQALRQHGLVDPRAALPGLPA